MSAGALLSISNPLATIEQLSASASFLDGIPITLERSLRYHGCLLTQAAGILLHLKQDVVAQSIITFTRFFVGPEGGSFRLHGVKDASAASVYMMAKISSTPQSPRDVLNAYNYLISPHSPFSRSPLSQSPRIRPSPLTYTLTEGDYQAQRRTLLAYESLILRQLSYTTRANLPHPLALTYLQTLLMLSSISEEEHATLAARTIAHLNSALLSPQLLYLTHQPHALAVAALYLAARETSYKISGEEWWQIWDVGREELGFLVVALGSLEGWVRKEGSDGLWKVDEVEAALQSRKRSECGGQY